MELQEWVDNHSFKAPADKKLRKEDGAYVKAFLADKNWTDIEIGNVLTHVRYFRLFPFDTLEEHRQRVQMGKGNGPVRNAEKRIPTVEVRRDYKVTARYHGIEIEAVFHSVEDLVTVLKSLGV